MSTSTVAYFSMEIALGDDVPTFSGGLGVLAGDHLRAAADAGIPVVGVTLVYHLGFFRQEIDEAGRQVEHAVHWRPADHLEPLDARVEVVIGGRNVRGRRVATGDPRRGRVQRARLLPRHEARRRTTPPTGPSPTSSTPGTRRYGSRRRPSSAWPDPACSHGSGTRRSPTYHLNEGHASLVPVALLSERLGGTVAEASACRHRGGP